MSEADTGGDGGEGDGEDLQSRVETWLTGQMPIIQMHGGTSAVRTADPDTGEVVVELGGACSGCGISPRTAQRIKVDLAQEFDVVEDVVVRFSDGSDSDWNDGQAESYMGIDRNEGGRGGRGEGSPSSDHF
ncbi:NifU family protein [Halospeciosus flavus]|uniref:NifU family protein n=1 Tax=Halospeciosus flavus TaxID=3032283 RepID=A0ABD5Z5R5_9EURY|nr:NifU family protein [Halospeciosus flavus]